MMNVNVGDQVVKFQHRWGRYEIGNVVAVIATQFTVEIGGRKRRCNRRDGRELGSAPYSENFEVIGSEQNLIMAMYDRQGEARQSMQSSLSAFNPAVGTCSDNVHHQRRLADRASKSPERLAKFKELCAKMQALAAEFAAFGSEG